MFMVCNCLGEGMALHRNIAICINLHGALGRLGMPVHRAFKNLRGFVGKSVQFALNICDSVVILSLDCRVQIPVCVAPIGGADISLHVLEICTLDSALKCRPLSVHHRFGGRDMQQKASILSAMSSNTNSNAGHKVFGVQVDGNRAHAHILLILLCWDSRTAACEELALGLKFIEFAIGWGSSNEGDKERKQADKEGNKALIEKHVGGRNSGFEEML